MFILKSLTVGLAVLLSVGCQSIIANTGSAPEPQVTDTSIPATTPEGEMQMTTAVPTSDDAALQSLIDLAKLDLASRLVVPDEKITLIEATEVEWSDSSLDCPQPGMDYLQVITPGYRILLEAGGQTYEYHSSGNNYVLFCENVNPPISPNS